MDEQGHWCVGQCPIHRQMSFVHRRRDTLLAQALVERHRPRWNIGHQWEVEPQWQVTPSKRCRHHPLQVLVEVGHQWLGALEGDDVSGPQLLRTPETRYRAAQTAEVPRQSVELAHDPSRGVRCDGYPAPEPRHDASDVRAQRFERGEQPGPFLLRVLDHIGHHVGEPGLFGVASQWVDIHRASSRSMPTSGPPAQMVSKERAANTVPPRESLVSTLSAIVKVLASQMSE